MKINTILIYLVIVVILVVAGYLLFAKVRAPQSVLPKDISKVSDQKIISIISKNKDGADYMQAHTDFKIQDRIVLTKESIVAGQKEPNFKEVYQGLALESNRYMRVDLINAAGDRGIVSVLDFGVPSGSSQAIKVYGIILIQSSAK